MWQKSMDLVVEIYTLKEQFPKSELYGLVSQMRRVAISIPSNIAEGRVRGHRKEYRQFLLNAYGSGAELETQIEIAKRLPRMKNLNYSKVDNLLQEIMKMLNKITASLRT
ncbi:MAG: four helix bundle protein [Patescibacteria group bacterium]|nr:four helix bundle protein [Patescibacteria group bacterium]